MKKKRVPARPVSVGMGKKLSLSKKVATTTENHLKKEHEKNIAA